ncbi:MAG: hypothetical protein L3J93_05820 [Thermoplasmata archaeon]|nr:hypothetical protein [Thermoplasmata archaeon]
MIARTLHSGSEFLLLGTVRGLASEVPPLLERLGAFAPDAIALGVSPDELNGVRAYFAHASSEPIVTLAPTESAEVRALAHYGDVRVPNPTVPAVLAWGESHGIPVEPVDPSDDRFAEMFAQQIGYFELVRRTLRERHLARHPPTPPTAEEFALEWGRPPSERGGSSRLILRREESVASSIRVLAQRHARVAVVIDRERFEPLEAALGTSPLPR